MKPQKWADELQEKHLEKYLSSILTKQEKGAATSLKGGKLFLFYTQIHGIKNCDATHSLSLNATEYCLDELRGNWASVNPKEVKVSLLLSLFLLPASPSQARGDQKVLVERVSCARKTKLLTATVPSYIADSQIIS